MSSIGADAALAVARKPCVGMAASMIFGGDRCARRRKCAIRFVRLARRTVRVVLRNRHMRRLLPLLAILAFFAAPAPAQELDRAAEYRQSAAVLARYADVPIALDTPALTPGRTDFTSQAEMEAYLAALKARVPGLVLGSLGRSQQGR